MKRLTRHEPKRVKYLRRTVNTCSKCWPQKNYESFIKSVLSKNVCVNECLGVFIHTVSHALFMRFSYYRVLDRNFINYHEFYVFPE